MRLIRLGEGTSEVGVDVRAALASWGRGDAVVGGIALTGLQPPGCPRPVEAIVVLPRGILVVIGVDLPDPAVRLDAPLAGGWKTDGWPLVRGDGAVNPAIDALAVVGAISARLERARVEPVPIGTVVAVGPYVSQVFQPTADLARGVRILHPEPMTLLTAVRELATYQRRCSVAGASHILATLNPAAPPMDPADLMTEGFADIAAPDMAAVSTALIPRITDPIPHAPAPALPAGRGTGQQLRWLPVSAAILVVLLLLAGIIFAISSAGSDADGTASRNANATPTTPPPIMVEGTAFQSKGSNKSDDCAKHAFGDVQVWLQGRPCGELIRLRFESTQEKERAAILVAVLRFTDSSSATELRAIADKPGSGAIADLAADGVAWPDGGKPAFESAAYASGREGNSVKIVQAVWLNRPSQPDDLTLRNLAGRALQLPVE